jgi:hypothetical protein
MSEDKIVILISFAIVSAIGYLSLLIRRREKRNSNKFMLTEGTMNKGGRNEHCSTPRPKGKPGALKNTEIRKCSLMDRPGIYSKDT